MSCEFKIRADKGVPRWIREKRKYFIIRNQGDTLHKTFLGKA